MTSALPRCAIHLLAIEPGFHHDGFGYLVDLPVACDESAVRAGDEVRVRVSTGHFRADVTDVASAS